MLEILCYPTSTSPSYAPYISAFAALISSGIAFVTVKQLLKKNKQEKLEKLEKQARQIATWIVKKRKTQFHYEICIQNTSNLPIYDVIIIAVESHGAGISDGKEAMSRNITEEINLYPYMIFRHIPPGKFEKSLGILDESMHKSFGLEIAFRDTNGTCWRISHDGLLSELKEKDYLYKTYQIVLPAYWDSIYQDDEVS